MMKLCWILMGTAAVLLVLCLLLAYICFRLAFYVPPRKPVDEYPIETPEGKIYEPYQKNMEKWIREARNLPHDRIEIRSFDGLKLCGKYYEYAPGAPIELMFHGYRGNSEKDLSGGVQRCFKLGRSALIVDQRCSRDSEGTVITFGVKEHRDCLSWLDYMVERFGPETKIILTGISMGAATVLTAAGKELPPNVIGVLADCGYTSAKDIIKKVIRQIGLPAEICYPFVKLGAGIYGHFDLEEASPLESMKTCKVPVLLFHGESDDFVPCEMSRQNYEACTARKLLITVPGAGHGLSYPLASEKYLKAASEFFITET